MATSLGYYSRTGFPTKHLRDNICAICGGDFTGSNIVDLNSSPRDSTAVLKTSWLQTMFYSPQSLDAVTAFQLNCGHKYHEKCIRLFMHLLQFNLRGWTLIGKKDCCAYCKEKVDLKLFKGSNPWDFSQDIYLNLIDACRYIIVWNPIVFIVVQFIFKVFGLH